MSKLDLFLWLNVKCYSEVSRSSHRRCSIRTPFLQNTSKRPLLSFYKKILTNVKNVIQTKVQFEMLKFTKRPKTALSVKGISSFAGDLVLIWMKQRLVWFSLQRDGTRNELSNIKETFTENLQLKMSVLCTKVWAFSKAGLSNLYDGWAK